jgi:putative DNA primase/helicase
MMAEPSYNDHNNLNGHSYSDVAPKPSYRFHGNLPASLCHLHHRECWVAWDYTSKGERWTKPPRNPHTGRLASVTDSSTWASFDVARAGMERHGFVGVGLVLTEEGGITGIDLDHCISDSGSLSPLAAEIIGYGETYGS